MTLLKHFQLWPKWKQWKGWSLPSKLTAFGTLLSVFGLIIALTTAGDKNNYEKESKRSEIKQKIDLCSEQIKIVNSRQNELYFQPIFTSQENAIKTLENLNSFIEASTELDVAMVYRIIKEYGNDRLAYKFSEVLNERHHNAKAVSMLVVSVVNSSGPKNVEELRNLYRDYAELL